MQFLHTVHCIVFNNFYNQYRNCYLFCLLSLVFKKWWCSCYTFVLKQQFTEIYKWDMSDKINIKNKSYYFCDDMINIKNFHSDLLTIDKKSHMMKWNNEIIWYNESDIYNISYIKIKKFSDFVNIHCVNPLCLIIYSATGHFKEKKTVKNT